MPPSPDPDRGRVRRSLFIPRYSPMAQGDWELRIMARASRPATGRTPAPVSGLPVLLRSRDTWMSLTPLEFESQGIGIRLARG